MYQLRVGDRVERQSSSGVLVSTGAGSTGWLSSVFNMVAGIASFTGGQSGTPMKLAWEDPRLVYVVREPFVSRHSQATLVAGVVRRVRRWRSNRRCRPRCDLSDGVPADALDFNSGAIARIGAASHRTRLVVG
jgi:hypothetical protein